MVGRVFGSFTFPVLLVSERLSNRAVPCTAGQSPYIYVSSSSSTYYSSSFSERKSEVIPSLQLPICLSAVLGECDSLSLSLSLVVGGPKDISHSFWLSLQAAFTAFVRSAALHCGGWRASPLRKGLSLQS